MIRQRQTITHVTFALPSHWHIDGQEYWLERLQSFVEFPVLFILGARHFESFASLLTQSGFQVFEVVRDWKPSSPSEADAWLEWIERRDASTETS